MKIKIAQFGLGPIGVQCIKLASSKPWAHIVGAVDIDPEKVGKPLADLCGVPTLGDVTVQDDLVAMLADQQPDVVLHTAGSGAAEALMQMAPVLDAGVHVVSSCEELLFPRLRAPDETAVAEERCRKVGARIVGTGVNPGFVLDVLPICLTGVNRSVERIYGERVVDASTRRMPLQRKIGSGMAPDTFRRLFKEGKAGHAGFQESLALIAHALGWSLGPIQETCEPVIADHDIQTEFFHVKQGETCGLHQIVEAAGDGHAIKLDLKMYLDAKDPHDAVYIQGDPEIRVRVDGGIAGDHATVAAMVNAVPRLLKNPPGVRLMTDLPVPCCA